MAALKAVAALPEILNQIKDGIGSIKIAVATRNLEEVRAEVREITDRLEVADADEIAELVRRLNSSISK